MPPEYVTSHSYAAQGKIRGVTGLGGFPRRFDNYVLLKPLARGGMGQLHLALAGSTGLEKLCVIKQVIPDLVASENSRRFRDEALVALRLAHGNMVSVFDAGMQGGQIFLAMEYVDGKDLLATWNRCADRRIPFPVDISVYIVKEITRALVYAHAFEDLKLVHRDVSPANVLLSYTGEVKLTDFGLAMSILKMERTTPGIVYGKLSYLSPEQARRQPLDGRVDIYAAGILLWELLTGRQLFPIASPADQPNPDAMARARNPEVVPPSTISGRVPPELDRIVMRALAVEREDRYPNAELLRADLAGFLAETAPKTDADRLAGFLRPLFADDARDEKRERDRLVAGSRAMLSGGHGVPSAGLGLPSASLRDEPPRQGEDPRIGTTLGGRYHIRRLCGEGAMGRVYEAQHIDIGRRVAIKVLHARFHHSADLVERFRREARAASKIGHPNIVDVTDSGTTPDGAFYFVMEFLDGVNLEDLILRNGPLPVERALLIGAQISRALEAAHAAEVIHRDLKPANVMLVNRNDEADFVKVLDFGISKDLDLAAGAALTRPDIAIGTPAYMAPEQAAGKTADALTDVYAVGGLLYEMLTATQPCSGEDAMDVLQRKASEDPRPIGELRPELPRDVQKLVMRALARAPGDRHWSMTALKEQILACLMTAEGAPTPTRAPSGSLTTPRLPLGSADTAVAHSVSLPPGPPRPPAWRGPAGRGVARGGCAGQPAFLARANDLRRCARRRRDSGRGAATRAGLTAATDPGRRTRRRSANGRRAAAPGGGRRAAPGAGGLRAPSGDARFDASARPPARGPPHVVSTRARGRRARPQGRAERDGAASRDARRYDGDPDPRTDGVRSRRLPGGDPPGAASDRRRRGDQRPPAGRRRLLLPRALPGGAARIQRRCGARSDGCVGPQETRPGPRKGRPGRAGRRALTGQPAPASSMARASRSSIPTARAVSKR